jgi:hypothetical protein
MGQPHVDPERISRQPVHDFTEMFQNRTVMEGPGSGGDVPGLPEFLEPRREAAALIEELQEPAGPDRRECLQALLGYPLPGQFGQQLLLRCLAHGQDQLPVWGELRKLGPDIRAVLNTLKGSSEKLSVKPDAGCGHGDRLRACGWA